MAEYFVWDKSKLTVSVDAMDREHQGLIAIMNKLHERHVSGASISEVEAALNELGAATTAHFANEERHMESIGYPGLVSHRLIHQDLLKSFKQHATDFRAKRKLEDEFFRFLRNWLVAHIQGIDRKYGAHQKLNKSA